MQARSVSSTKMYRSVPAIVFLGLIAICCFLLVRGGTAQQVRTLRVDPRPRFEPPQSPPASPSTGDSCATCGPASQTPVDGVLLFSSEAFQQVTDLRIEGRGLDLAWTRSYRSREGGDTSLGKCWTHSYDVRLTVAKGQPLSIHGLPPRVLELQDGTGRRTHFHRNGMAGWEADEHHLEITREGSGAYLATFADTGVWEFHPLGNDPLSGRLSRIADRNGNEITLDYSPQGRLIGIRDTLDSPSNARLVQIGYNPAGQISTVTDFVGRQVKYEYYLLGDGGGSEGDLKSVTSPVVTGTPNGNDFPSGKTTVYTYTSGTGNERTDHNLLTVTDPKGQSWLGYTYSTATDPQHPLFDRVEQVTLGAPGDVTDIFRTPLAPTANNGWAVLAVIVNDRMGHVARYEYDGKNRIVRSVDYTGAADPDQQTNLTNNLPTGKLRATDPASFQRSYRYNSDSHPIEVSYPNGNSVEYTYELELDPSATRRSRGNLRQIRRLPGPLGGLQPEIVETFEYDTGMGGCCGSNFVTLAVDGRGNATVQEYDGAGNRLHTVHPVAGVEENWEYNSFGQVTAHILPDNGSGIRRRDEYTYFAAGSATGYLQSEIEDADSLSLTCLHERDAVGNSTRFIDPRGNDSLAEFNALDQLVRQTSREVTSGGGFRYSREYWYDANDNLVQIDLEHRDETGASMTNSVFTERFGHDILNNVIRETREVDTGHDVVVEYEYDAEINLILERFGESTGGDQNWATDGPQPGNRVARHYDERDLLYREVRAPGTPIQSTRQFDYDGNGVLWARHEGLEGTIRTTLLDHDGYNRLIRTTGPMGNVSIADHDASSNVVLTRVEGELLDVSGDAGNVRLSEVALTYDGMNRVTRQETAFFDSVTQAPIGDGLAVEEYQYTATSKRKGYLDDRGNLTAYSYDSMCRMQSVTDAAGNVTTLGYDANGNRTSQTDLEKSGSGGPDQSFLSTYAYDGNNRLILQADSLGNSFQFEFGSLALPLQQRDPRGNILRMEPDGLNRLVTRRTSLTDDGTGSGAGIGEIVCTETWDDSGRCIARDDGEGNVTRYAYDALDRRIAVRHPDGSLHQTGSGISWTAGTDRPDLAGFVSGYDPHDNAVLITDANGSVVTNSYDLRDRLIVRSVVPGSGVSLDTTAEAYGYDGLSRLVSASDNDSLVASAHDSLGNLVSETTNGREVTAIYDGVSNRAQLTYPGGRVLDCTYDALNRVNQISDAIFMLASFSYFGPGRLEYRELEGSTSTNTVRVEYGYDGARRVTSTTAHRDPSGNPSLLDSRTYSWDESSNKISRHKAGANPVTVDWSHDSANRIVASDWSVLNGNPTTIDYQLDLAGNRTQVTGGPDAGSYAMQGGDDVLNQYSNTPQGTVQHDAKGNAMAIDSGLPGERQLTWDYRDRLVQVFDVATGKRHTYQYDPLDRRIAKIRDADGAAIETRYVYDAWNVIEEQDSSGTTEATYVRGAGPDELLGMQRGGSNYRYLQDDQNSVIALVDDAGLVVERYRCLDYGFPTVFDANGSPLASSAIGNPYVYTGRRYDGESGYYDYRTRYLDPSLGRFLSRDRLGTWEDVHGLGNARTYTGNNPSSARDPMGTVSWYYRSSSVLDSVVITKFTDCHDSGAMSSIADHTLEAFEAGYSAFYAVFMSYFALGSTTTNQATYAEMKRYFRGTDSVYLSRDDQADIFGVLYDVYDRHDSTVNVECESASNSNCNSTAAYVWSTNRRIHICPGYWSGWSAARRPAVMYHEMSHAYANTDDNGYMYNIGTSSSTPEYQNFSGTSIGRLTKSELKENADTYAGFVYYNWM
jgi:RHS repeat-associated protein